jgi:hypothetical protein
MVAAKMIAAAKAGEWDATRLREAASLALRDDNVVPLSMTFASRLHPADVASSAGPGKRYPV